MRKISMFAGIAAAAIGMASLTSGSAFAMGCLTDQSGLPPISLSQTAMTPNAGFEYNKAAYDAALAKGNYCGPVQQSYPVSGNTTRNNPDEPVPNATHGNFVQ